MIKFYKPSCSQQWSIVLLFYSYCGPFKLEHPVNCSKGCSSRWRDLQASGLNEAKPWLFPKKISWIRVATSFSTHMLRQGYIALEYRHFNILERPWDKPLHFIFYLVRGIRPFSTWLAPMPLHASSSSMPGMTKSGEMECENGRRWSNNIKWALLLFLFLPFYPHEIVCLNVWDNEGAPSFSPPPGRRNLG